ncbi:J domain-containing protein [Streptomyces sp. NPDC126499]|uniref:J domain-containing protein n=1 Tax=Streptomyces sp. NPDC126499 TaxID=3155314 RepID=UPI00332C435C
MTAPRQPDHYAVLGVDPTASLQQITSAYRALLRALHPDAHPGRPAQPEKLAEVITAYATLRDGRRRAEYDAARRTTAVPVRRRSGFPRPPERAYVVVIGPRPAPALRPRGAWLLRAGPVIVDPSR